jgi:transcriptional regulator with XRE-family HTH domain
LEKPVPLSRDIYPNLKLRIYTAGIRQNRLAKMIGIDEAYLSKIINGFREPSGSVRESIAEVLNSDPDWLFQKLQISAEGPLSDQPTHRNEE